MNKQIEIPTYVYMSVDYTDGLTGQAARDSYKGVTLRVEYGGWRIDTRSYFTGDFVADYNAAIAWFAGFDQADSEVPFMGSSSVDSFMFDAGYDTEENATDQAALDAWKTEATPSADAVARFTAVTDRAVEIDRKLEAAWDRVPAAKLRWALANVIASSDYNTSYPGAPLGRAEAMDAIAVLNDLLADEDFADSMRPRD